MKIILQTGSNYSGLIAVLLIDIIHLPVTSKIGFTEYRFQTLGFPYVRESSLLVKSAPCKLALSINDPTASGPSSRPSTSSSGRAGRERQQKGQGEEKEEGEPHPGFWYRSAATKVEIPALQVSAGRINPNYIGLYEIYIYIYTRIYGYLHTYMSSLRACNMAALHGALRSESFQLLPDSAKANPAR